MQVEFICRSCQVITIDKIIKDEVIDLIKSGDIKNPNDLLLKFPTDAWINDNYDTEYETIEPCDYNQKPTIQLVDGNYNVLLGNRVMAESKPKLYYTVDLDKEYIDEEECILTGGKNITLYKIENNMPKLVAEIICKLEDNSIEEINAYFELKEDETDYDLIIL